MHTHAEVAVPRFNQAWRHHDEGQLRVRQLNFGQQAVELTPTSPRPRTVLSPTSIPFFRAFITELPLRCFHAHLPEMSYLATLYEASSVRIAIKAEFLTAGETSLIVAYVSPAFVPSAVR